MQGVYRSGVFSQKIRCLSEYSILLAHRPVLIGWLPEPEAWLTFLDIKLTGNWGALLFYPGMYFRIPRIHSCGTSVHNGRCTLRANPQMLYAGGWEVKE